MIKKLYKNHHCVFGGGYPPPKTVLTWTPLLGLFPVLNSTYGILEKHMWINGKFAYIVADYKLG
jgi:hypothetical protein